VSLGRTLNPAVRIRVMRSIRAQDTRPEQVVRKLLWALGARYRLHARDLPGRPDIVLRGRRLAILVHGCFWHQHPGCPLARTPRSRPEYWPQKLRKNQERDARNLIALRELGWTVLVIWECEIAHPEAVQTRLRLVLAETAPLVKRASHSSTGLREGPSDS